jgi:flagellar biosynthesis protein FlhG
VEGDDRFDFLLETDVMRKRRETRKLCITSGKGGVGKTSFAVNVAFALANKGYHVLLIDGDLGLANVDVLMGLSVSSNIRHILEGDADPLETVVFVEENLGVLPATSGVPEMVTLGPDDQTRLGRLLDGLANHFDYVLMDTAAGIGPSVLWFNNFVDHNIVLLTPDPTSLTDAYALIKILSQEFRRDHFQLILNFVRDEQEARQTFTRIQSVAKKFLDVEVVYLGAIPDDDAVNKAVRRQLPFVQGLPESKAAQAVLKLAARIETLNGGL